MAVTSTSPAGNIYEGTDDDDYLEGSSGNDVLVGRKGYDVLAGGAGDDTYRYDIGDGSDLIYDFGGNDTLEMGVGLSAADIQLSRSEWDLYIDVLSSNERLTVEGFFNDEMARIESLRFADGTVWDAAILNAAPLVGTDDDDYLAGGSGNEVLVGRKGNDVLAGGPGDDTYRYDIGDGSDWIYEFAGNDTLEMGAGLSAADIQLSRSEWHLYIDVLSSNERLTVEGFFNDETYRIESLSFVDGTVWDAAILNAAPLVGYDGYHYGSNRNDMPEAAALTVVGSPLPEPYGALASW